MPNTKETVRPLIKAFNVNNYNFLLMLITVIFF
jgi:hypothetical protein